MLVVLHHAMNMVEEQAGIGSSLIASTFRNNDFGAGGVDLFFVISGFVMSASLDRTASSEGVGAFIRRRFLRIIPLFWIMACMFVDLKRTQGEGPTLASVVNTVCILPIFDLGRYDLPILSVGWTLAFEFVFYGIVAASLALPPSKRQACVVGTLATLALLGVFVRPGNNAAAIAINPILLEFLFGVGVYRLAKYHISWHLSSFVLATGLLALAWSAFGSPGFNMDPWVLIAGETSLGRVASWGIPWALIVFGCTKLPNKKNILTGLGDASYSIYLSHMIILTMISIQWNTYYHIPADIILVISIPIAIGSGVLTFFFVEKPLLRILSKLSVMANQIFAVRPASPCS